MPKAKTTEKEAKAKKVTKADKKKESKKISSKAKEEFDASSKEEGEEGVSQHVSTLVAKCV